MKKLMIMAALVASVGLCQAAQVDWYYATGADDDGLTIYMLTGSPATFTSSAALIAASISSGEITEDCDPDYFANGTVNNDAITKTSATAYFAIINSGATQYKVTSAFDMTSKVYDPAAQEASKGNYLFDSSSFGAYKDFETPGPEPTPEPTSAMLMLLGMAGLALKRKRA